MHPRSFWEFIAGICALVVIVVFSAVLLIAAIHDDKSTSVSSCRGHGGLKQIVKTGDETYNSSLMIVCTDGYTFRKEF